MSHDEVNEDSVYLVTGQPLPNDIAKIVEWMLNEDYTTAYESECCCSAPAQQQFSPSSTYHYTSMVEGEGVMIRTRRGKFMS